MGWFYLFLGILLEVTGTISMKESKGFSLLIPSCTVFVAYSLCLIFVTLAINKIGLNLAYAIWAGLGTAIIATIGIVYYKEPATIMKVVSIGLIILGVIGLNLESAQ